MASTPEELLEGGEHSIDSVQREWLEPLGPFRAVLHRLFYAANWSIVRTSLQFRVEGLDRLPMKRPMIFAPNHESSLDAPLLAAALPYQTVRHTYWAGRKDRVLTNAAVRFLNRVAQTIPIDRDVSALAAGAAVLQRGHNLVWFPEGTRTRDGKLQEFKFGVAALAHHFQVPVVPVGIDGAFEAFPPEAWCLRVGTPVCIRFGEPLSSDQVETDGDRSEAYRAVADKLRDRVRELN